MIYSQFEKAAKHYEELVERLKEVNEFWINSVLSSTKEFFNTIKTK
jgi:predicted RNase H-like HicB family nuclease